MLHLCCLTYCYISVVLLIATCLLCYKLLHISVVLQIATCVLSYKFPHLCCLTYCYISAVLQIATSLNKSLLYYKLSYKLQISVVLHIATSMHSASLPLCFNDKYFFFVANCYIFVVSLINFSHSSIKILFAWSLIKHWIMELTHSNMVQDVVFHKWQWGGSSIINIHLSSTDFSPVWYKELYLIGEPTLHLFNISFGEFFFI